MGGAATPPPPVLVTSADLPRILLIVVVGYGIIYWLALQLDAYFAADTPDDEFYYPYVWHTTISACHARG